MRKYIIKDGFLVGLLLALCFIIIFTSIFYFVYKLNNLTIILVAALTILGLIILRPRLKLPKLSIRDFLPSFLLCALTLTGFFILLEAQTAESIVSPWTVVNKTFFIILAAAIFIAFLLKKAPVAALFPIFLLASGVALIVYKIGYGFDGFLHEAALRYISEHGAITPKTPYYIGQYGLEIFLRVLSGWPLGLINQALLPVLFALIVPLLGRLILAGEKNTAPILLLLLFPISSFIATTPQGLANLFLIALAFIGWEYLEGRLGALLPILLAFGTAFIHIISGLPAFIFLAVLLLTKNNRLPNRKAILAAGLGAALVVPLIFFVAAKIYPDLINFELTHNSFKKFFSGFFEFQRRYNFWLDLAYLAGFLAKILLAALTIWGIKSLRKPTTGPYCILFLALLFDFAIIYKFFSFPALIFYEQSDFAARYFEIAFYFLMPLVVWGGALLFQKLNSLSRLARLISLAFVALLAASAVYLSYPRKDAYSVSHGYSTSVHDLRAVQAIARDAGEKNYIVLANQAMGAAALREFGFTRPYLVTARGEVYFYSIPTGGELYKYYLKMVYEKPEAKIAEEAGRFAGVETVYLVINDYWWNAKKLIESAKQEATNWQEIDDGKIYIFKFQI